MPFFSMVHIILYVSINQSTN